MLIFSWTALKHYHAIGADYFLLNVFSKPIV